MNWTKSETSLYRFQVGPRYSRASVHYAQRTPSTVLSKSAPRILEMHLALRFGHVIPFDLEMGLTNEASSCVILVLALSLNDYSTACCRQDRDARPLKELLDNDEAG